MTVRKSPRKKKTSSSHKTGLLLICTVMLAMIGLGVIYKVEIIPVAPVSTPASVTAPKVVNSRVDQLCQQKLLEHIKQGGVNLQAEMSYGNLQGCRFMSEAEQRGPAIDDIEMSIIKRSAIAP